MTTSLRRYQPLAIVLLGLVVSYLILGIQQFQNFMTLGAVYALVALGYTMVYGIIELINFAHGDVFMVGAFTALWILTVPLGLLDRTIDDALSASPEHEPSERRDRPSD